MKRRFLLGVILAVTTMFTLPACGGKDSPSPAEENLVITGNPALNGQQESPAPGPTFPLAVTVTSKMPPQGVKVAVTATPEGSTTSFYTDTKTTSSAVSNFVITNTPKSVSCRVTVTVTSVSKASNTVTAFYLYSMK